MNHTKKAFTKNYGTSLKMKNLNMEKIKIKNYPLIIWKSISRKYKNKLGKVLYKEKNWQTKSKSLNKY